MVDDIPWRLMHSGHIMAFVNEHEDNKAAGNDDCSDRRLSKLALCLLQPLLQKRKRIQSYWLRGTLKVLLFAQDYSIANHRSHCSIVTLSLSPSVPAPRVVGTRGLGSKPITCAAFLVFLAFIPVQLRVAAPILFRSILVIHLTFCYLLLIYSPQLHFCCLCPPCNISVTFKLPS